jgi:5-methylcytosine-specific restriction protein A
MLRDVLAKIATEYPAASGQSFADHPLAEFIRNDAAEMLERSIGVNSSRYRCKGSAGNGNFANVPWLAVFDSVVTLTATKEYYVVYLFAADGGIHLSLNQGTTAVREEFKRLAPDVLKDRAALMRARLPDFVRLLPVTNINLS